MALVASNLMKAEGFSDGPKLFTYVTADLTAVVAASGYFNAVADQLEVNDIILAVTASGGVQVLQAYYVDAITGAGVVTTVKATFA